MLKKLTHICSWLMHLKSASPNQYMIFETMFGVRLTKKSNPPCYISFVVVVVGWTGGMFVCDNFLSPSIPLKFQNGHQGNLISHVFVFVEDVHCWHRLIHIGPHALWLTHKFINLKTTLHIYFHVPLPQTSRWTSQSCTRTFLYIPAQMLN